MFGGGSRVGDSAVAREVVCVDDSGDMHVVGSFGVIALALVEGMDSGICVAVVIDIGDVILIIGVATVACMTTRLFIALYTTLELSIVAMP